MTLTWFDASEIVTGKLILGRVAPTLVRPDLFAPPYNDIVKSYLNGNQDVSILTSMFGGSVLTCLNAEEAVGDSNQLDWVRTLEEVQAKYSAGVELDKIASGLKKGKPVDLSVLNAIADKAVAGLDQKFTPAYKITPMETPFIKVGWRPLDTHLGGLPQVGLIIIGARPKTGKTTTGLVITKQFLKKYPEKKAAFVSAEMMGSELRMRMRELEELPKDVLKRWMIADSLFDVNQIVNYSAAIENLGLLVVDFADMLVKEISEPEYTKLYMALSKAAKQLQIPIILLAQLSGAGGLPRPNNLRWTRLAEALAWMVLMIWNPDSDPYASEDVVGECPLEILEGKRYLISWMVRGGFRQHLEDSPGAIAIHFSGEKGWRCDDSKYADGQWFSLRHEAGERKKKRRY